jgi:hypothetical protein
MFWLGLIIGIAAALFSMYLVTKKGDKRENNN